MSDLVRAMPSTTAQPLPYQYPFAAAPDVIRAHQKDAYYQGELLERLTSVLRSLRGARFAHQHSAETRTAAALLYLGLTTLLGHRTLGEEYCDIVQLSASQLALPSLLRRAAYIACAVLVPYGLDRVLPALRRRLRAALERSPSRSPAKTYALTNLEALTSPAPLYAVGLAAFYFSGAYYSLSKRAAGLRYVFTRRLDPAHHRIGYEVLGVLLALQLAVQAYGRVRAGYGVAGGAGAAVVGPGVEIGLDPEARADDGALLLPPPPVQDGGVEARVRGATNTPRPDEGAEGARYGLADGGAMRWIEGAQARKCTLCLEAMRDPAATTCGHVFCWGCIRDWLVERAECPLCRQECGPQHVLALRS